MIEKVYSRQTVADHVYAGLHKDIVSLKLLPGDKVSETDVSRQFEVSRQPVREAFIRLHNAGLLLVQPQRATEVCRISEAGIQRARFIRLAVEIELVRCASIKGLRGFRRQFRDNLAQQKRAIDTNQRSRFQELDYQFHHLICKVADRGYAFGTIESSKAQVARLCMLSLSDPAELQGTYEDHVRLVELLDKKQSRLAEEAMRKHLLRLDAIIQTVKASHADYFE